MKSKRGNKYTQVFMSSNHWIRTLKGKADTDEGLSVLFGYDAVLPNMMMNGSLEQMEGHFWHTFQNANCHCKQSKPHLDMDEYC